MYRPLFVFLPNTKRSQYIGPEFCQKLAFEQDIHYTVTVTYPLKSPTDNTQETTSLLKTSSTAIKELKLKLKLPDLELKKLEIFMPGTDPT